MYINLKGVHMTIWNTIAADTAIEKTIASLKENGITSMVVGSIAEAKSAALSLIPKQSEVMTMTSVTLDKTGIEPAINASGDYIAVKPKLYALDRNTQEREMQKMGAAPDYAIGSVHAVTEDGKIVVASNTGSQLPAYAYGASHVVFVAGAQKIVPTLDDAMDRIYNHVLPLESERAHAAYGVPASNISKLLIITKEVHPDRITVIFVKESVGF